MKQKSATTPKPQMGLTFEDVWAMFQETAKRQEETDRQIRETHKQIGELGNKFGAVVEHMMIPNLKEKFNALGYEFGKVSTNVIIETKEEGTIAEIDIFLENGDCAMAGAIFSDNAKKYALKQGLYIIEQSGDTVRIIEPSGGNLKE
jgi:hypothetical protein